MAVKKPSNTARILRTLAKWFVVLMCVASVAFNAAILTRNQWLLDTNSVSSGLSVGQQPATWTEFSPISGYCSCTDNLQGYCNERNDAFAGSSYLSVAILSAQSLMTLLLVLELTAYGLYGGTHTTTKVSLILGLIILATQTLSVISFHTAFSDNHCGDDSFKDRGATLGWAFYYRGGEMAVTLAIVAFTIKSFSRTHRGPPCGPILIQMLFNIISSISTFSSNWMSLEEQFDGAVRTKHYSTWNSCVCYEPCSSASDHDTTMLIAFILTIVSCIAAFITAFFVVLRAVDNEGVTLKFAQIFSGITMAVMIGNLANILATDFKVDCSGTEVSYQRFSSIEFLILAFCCQLTFFVLNALYMLPACAFCGKSPLHNGRAVVDGNKKRVFHVAWWDHLSDAKTIAHELRAAENEDGDDDDDDDSDEDEEMDPVVELEPMKQMSPPKSASESPHLGAKSATPPPPHNMELTPPNSA